MKILIVEDDYASSEMLRLSLEKEGYECFQAEDGKQALKVHEDIKPDLIVSDIRMPAMNGMELLERLRKTEKDAIIILITGHGNEEMALKALELGANNYIKKPVSLPEFKLIVRRYNNILESKNLSKHLPKLIEDRTLTLDLPTDTTLLSSVIDFFQEKICHFFTAKELFQIELGLSELLTNAIEHGNLGISNAEKTNALKNNCLNDLYEERLKDPKFTNRKAKVIFCQTKQECSWEITDEGDGFNWKTLPNPTHMRHIGELHGRGVFLSKLQFDSLEYNQKGNSVRVSKKIAND